MLQVLSGISKCIFMLKKVFVALLCLSLVLATSLMSLGWGVWGHEHINRAAVFALPESMRAFYFNHIDFITIEASIPDVRKYAINARNEFPRHYIDLEKYGAEPFKSLPEDWDAAVAKYGKDSLYKNGILPWYIQQMTDKLTKAFKKQDKALILFLSADLAHYIGDACQPLHTTENYDGQLTGQKGVHAFFESLLPERYGAGFNLHTPPARYYDNIEKASWDILRESHALVRPLLNTEKKLLDSWPKDSIYRFNKKGKILKNQYRQPYFTPEFSKAFYQNLNGMIGAQMRHAIQTTADFWYTAWVNAGKPDLNILDDKYSFKMNRRSLRKAYKLWRKKGKLIEIKSSAEF